MVKTLEEVDSAITVLHEFREENVAMSSSSYLVPLTNPSLLDVTTADWVMSHKWLL